MMNITENMFEMYEYRKPIILWLNERKFNNLIALCKNTGIKTRLLDRTSNDGETFFQVEIKDSISLLEIALEKSTAYEEKIKYFSQLKEEAEHLFI